MNQQTTLTTFLLFGFSLGACAQIPLRTYFYVNKLANWTEARQYCRMKYTDLATIESQSDINQLDAGYYYPWAWLGLWDDPGSWINTMGNESNSWRWSTTGETGKTSYHKWNPGDPDYYRARETCVVIYLEGEWYDASCDMEKTFLCYQETQQKVKTFAYVQSWKTWSSAQTYCREHYTDLAMIENEAENTKAQQTKPASADVWIGLYREPWSWSDKSPSLFQNWGFKSPDNQGFKEHCAAEDKFHEWDDNDCSAKNIFICHQDSRRTTTVRMATVSHGDLTDPAVNNQMVQQLGALLRYQGWTNVKIQCNVLPKEKDR